MATLARYPSLVAAQLAQGRLEAHGIRASIPDLHLASIDPRYAAMTGVRLDVADAEMDTARRILATDEPEDPALEAEGEALDGPKCPRCHARYAYWERSSTARTLSILLLGIPLLFTRRGWHCRKCDNFWDGPPPMPLGTRPPYRS